MDYLHPQSFYNDQYDLHTIEECLDYYNGLRDRFLKERKTTFSKYSDEKFNQQANMCINLAINSIKGERYRNKASTIQEWMERDRSVQERYDAAKPPSGVTCKVCHGPVRMTMKDLLDSYDPNARVTFMFECTKCHKRQSLYEDGSEWIYDPPKCPKCKSSLKSSMIRKNDVLTTKYKCSKCSYTKTDVDDFKKSNEEFEAKKAQDKKLLDTYRNDFVLDDEKGKEYIELMEKEKVGKEVFEEERRKFAGEVYQRSLQLRKITIAELEKRLSPLLEKELFMKFSLEKPEIGQFVIVPFSLQDGNSSRKAYESSSLVEKMLKKALEDTNWRLMSDGVRYRLGYLSGSLKGYEQEEDMLSLAGKKKEQKQLVESEARRKYAGDNVVQLARLMGEFTGVQDARKRRLEKEPDGFFLNDGKEGYTCGVCGDHLPGEKIWWDLHGIRCADCQRNFKAGVVPLEMFEDDYGYDVVIKSWNFRDYYGVHPSSIKKLRREGLLHGRDLKREDGTIYYTIYLVSENKEFLKKYPKKEKMKVTYQQLKK